MLRSEITAISPLDGRYGDKLEQLRPIVSEYGLIFYRLQVEVHWLILLSKILPEVKPLSVDEVAFLDNICEQFQEADAQAIKKIEATINHDVKSVEYFLREKLSKHKTLNRLSPFIHFALTSEDVNNIAYACMIKKARDELLIPALENLVRLLNTKAHETAELSMLSRTHGQPATPTTLGKEFSNFSVRLKTQLDYLTHIPIAAKCNGAVGNFNAHLVAYPEVDWMAASKSFVESFGLHWNLFSTQIEFHDFLAQFFNALSLCHTILIDFARDIWGYISLNYFIQKHVDAEVGSSTMPHKINPIDFENAEGNLGLCIALSTFLSQKLPISRWQRDLTDSTVLRNMGCVFGYAFVAYQSLEKGLSKLTPNKTYLTEELNNHWEVLTEAAQTVMRKHGIVDAYEQLKKFSRGEKITQQDWLHFVEALALPAFEKEKLKVLTPSTYTGYATPLSRRKK